MTGIGTAAASTPSGSGRIIILMVWDGLRPDSVNGHDTPELAAMIGHGVRFAHHHSVYPSITMVNAAALATGSAPGGDGIFGDSMYFVPSLEAQATLPDGPLKSLIAKPFSLEDSHKLAVLNGADGINGAVNGFPSLAHSVTAVGGYVALIGKQGPTYLFDSADLAASPTPKNLLFVADDMALPESMAATLAAAPKISRDDAGSIAARDAWFTRLAIDEALPAAAAASAAGHPALIVLWQHNPDLSQHMFGLGTRQALDAVTACDRNLKSMRGAIAAKHLKDRTDVIVVSDHGFATIKAVVPLADLLVAARLKESASSNDIVVAHNGGSDLVYLSRERYGSPKIARIILTQIVDFAAGQKWCGPIFSRDPDPSSYHAGAKRNYLGSIPGTFSQSYFGLANAERTPDLIISFREMPDRSNFGVTGPMNPAFVATIGPTGSPRSITEEVPNKQNHSSELVRPADGLMYADAGVVFTTGMGMHGAAGERELHNFGAAIGPDFKEDFTDTYPTSNSDIAPTIYALMNQKGPNEISGRALTEALAPPSVTESGSMVRKTTHVMRLQPIMPLTLTASVAMHHEMVVTTIHAAQYDGRVYMDSSDVAHTPH